MTQRTTRWAVVGLILTMAGISSLQAGSVTAGATLFEAHRWRGSLSVGSGQGSGDTYMVAGLGLGYFLARGLELGLDGEAWVGADPQIYKVTPGIRYIYSGIERFWPYVGAFYRRTIYSGLTDLNSYGGRYGAYMSLGGNAYAGFGGVSEKLVDCDEKVYDSCTSNYPEITFSLSF
ncbi:MAG: hypothetical protein IPP35_01300 [Elusimicrobia bacterium]|nr:hypothetical protein [Elusimicrobiota bacterium]